MLIAYDNEKHPKNEIQSMAQRVYRFKVVRTFLKVGVVINKIDQFREIFEEQGYPLSHSSNLSSVIDEINKEEKEKVKEEITGRNVSVIFDGTTHVSEAMNIILRFVSDDWKIEQRLVKLLLVTKSSGRASVNYVAFRTLKILYPNLVDIGCFSHTLHHVGEKMETPVLHQFIKAWISLFAHSPKAELHSKHRQEKFSKPTLLKAAKYGIQKPLTCRATLLRFKFLVDVSRFSPCRINLSRNKSICYKLKKCSSLIG